MKWKEVTKYNFWVFKYITQWTLYNYNYQMRIQNNVLTSQCKQFNKATYWSVQNSVCNIWQHTWTLINDILKINFNFIFVPRFFFKNELFDKYIHNESYYFLKINCIEQVKNSNSCIQTLSLSWMIKFASAVIIIYFYSPKQNWEVLMIGSYLESHKYTTLGTFP